MGMGFEVANYFLLVKIHVLHLLAATTIITIIKILLSFFSSSSFFLNWIKQTLAHNSTRSLFASFRLSHVSEEGILGLQFLDSHRGNSLGRATIQKRPSPNSNRIILWVSDP